MISRREGNSTGCTQTYYLPNILSKTVWKWNRLDREMWRMSLAPPSFSKWRDFCPIRWIRRIGHNHPWMNRIQLQVHTRTENILEQLLEGLTAKQVIWIQSLVKFLNILQYLFCWICLIRRHKYVPSSVIDWTVYFKTNQWWIYIVKFGVAPPPPWDF